MKTLSDEMSRKLTKAKKLDQIWLFGKDWWDFISLRKYIKATRPFYKHHSRYYEKMETNLKTGMNRSPETDIDMIFFILM